MKKILALVGIIIVGAGVWYALGGRWPKSEPSNTKAPASSAPSPSAAETPIDESAPNITFERFFETLSKSEQECLTRAIGSARINAWVKDPNVEPTADEQKKMDTCLGQR